MASSSEESSGKANILGKRNPEDDLETKPILKKHKETTEGLADCIQQESAVIRRTLFICNLPPQSEISDIIDFFKNVVQVVRVRLFVSRNCTHRRYGHVEFASSNEAKKAMELKNGEYLLGYQITLLAARKTQPRPRRPMISIDHKVCNRDYLPIEEDETPPDFVEEVLFVANLSPQTKILHIKDFFKDLAEVVSLRLIVNHEGKHVGYGFVDFASANEAKKALENKNGEYLLDHKIFLVAAKTAPCPPRPKYNLAERLCYEDYLRRQNLLIEEDETVEGLDETPSFVEAVAVRKKTLFVSGLPREAEISHIINFFKDVGQVVCLRLIVDYTGEHVGNGFVEFASANEAEKALEKKNGEFLHDHKIFLDVDKKAPYPPRPKYCIDHKVWYEDYLRRESLLIKEDEAVEGLDENILDFVEEVAARRRTLFIANIPYKSKIKEITNFFRNVGCFRVVLFRVSVDHRGQRVGCGFIEFASAKEAEKALEIIHTKEFCLDVVEIAPYPLRPKYNLAEKLWSKVENILIEEEDEKVEYEEEEDEEVEYEDEEEEDDLENKHILTRLCGRKVIFSYDD